ncbi:MAG TPA: DUF2244 domain-containing protein [Beijerinckiaceae bacterium]|jgi:uncharacterized membrane protein|nr:DUF2244 domain-containing protein [Beijerinckiaceae bacterium]
MSDGKASASLTGPASTSPTDDGEASAPPTDPVERPVFAAVIRPHRSLGPSGFRIVMTLCCLAMVVASVPFIVLGFWPVSGFFGLDLLALYIAFRVNYRRGRSFEEVVLTPIELLFRRVTHRGQTREWRLNPLWTKLDRGERDEDFGLQHLALVSRGERIVIARELSPPERESLADALGKALADVKRGF